ncbi:hypothetical protein T484DRAFT_1789590 [Baffinella frigidus]|nr:hypothetical protein T484DRAFT_1789590 [Cryptophyta sp. CCMP2293]
MLTVALAQCRVWLTANVPGAEIVAESSTARSALMAAQADPLEGIAAVSSYLASELYNADPLEGIAAVSSYLASELYNVPVKASSIQDLTSNMTRFVVVRKQHPGGLPETDPTGDDKTMLVLNISDRVGALHEILNVIQQHSINLARIESRPSKSKILNVIQQHPSKSKAWEYIFLAWEYIFFVDLHGHCQEANIKEVLEELKPYCSYIR